MNKAHVLLVDDDGDALFSLTRALKGAGLDAAIHAAATAAAARELFVNIAPQVAVLDLCLDPIAGTESGLALLKEFSANDGGTRTIVLTGHGGVEQGVRALNHGAASFLEKPAEISHLKALILDGIKQADLRRAYKQLQVQRGGELSAWIIGASPAAAELRDGIMEAAHSHQSLLICGETGTGKGLCAQVIHRLSMYGRQAFVRYQPYFGTADMVASDLFGHVKGAFTGALDDRRGLLDEAGRGTLFLDEVDELPPETQVSLLGVLQDKKFRPLGSNREHKAAFRLISATNRDVRQCLEEGRLRPDFYHRIAQAVLKVPALRERKGDIPLLCDHILSRLRAEEEVSVYALEDEALKYLCTYDWPGNVRELEGVVEGGAFRAQYRGRTVIKKEDLRMGAGEIPPEGQSFGELVENYKLSLLKQALQACGGNQARAAKYLGMDRSTLRRILARAGR